MDQTYFTPGPYRILEVIPSTECLWTKAPEGHDAIKSQTNQERSIGIRSTTDNMRDVYGSCEGGHLADIQITYGPEGRAQALANAHLIAAAPDLYEALSGLIEWLDFEGDALEEQTIIDRAKPLARAALARARGDKNGENV